MKRKRILIVHSTLHIGGAEEVTANLCNGIDKSRYEVSVCYLKEKGVVGEKIEEQGTAVIGLPSTKMERTDYFTSFKLRKIIARMGIDLVHSHDVHALTDCSICKLTLPGLKFVHTFHYGNYPEREISLKRFERVFWRVPSKLVAVSNNQRKGIQQLYGIPDERILTVWNGVDVKTDPGAFDVVEKYRAQGRVVIGSINTLIEQKGMFDLIKVANKLKERLPGKFVFLVAGNGHLKDRLQQEIESKGLQDDVCLMGWVKQASVKFLPHVDIFFQPSLWEAMSMVLLEAMSEAKAIVATKVGETPLIVEEEVEAKLAEPGDIDSMVDSLSDLVVDYTLRELYGKKARQRYLNNYTAREMARRYEALYQSLLDG